MQDLCNWHLSTKSCERYQKICQILSWSWTHHVRRLQNGTKRRDRSRRLIQTHGASKTARSTLCLYLQMQRLRLRLRLRLKLRLKLKLKLQPCELALPVFSSLSRRRLDPFVRAASAFLIMQGVMLE